MNELTPTADQLALAHVVLDIEKAASLVGWDHAPSLYALVRTATLLDQPDLPEELKDALRQEWDGTDTHLSAIIQEDFQWEYLEDMLAHLAWPSSVVGAALSLERDIVPPEVEAQAPEDPDEALAFISNHPKATDVRIAAGALRSGETWSALRARTFDSDDKVGQGSQLVPGLTDALLASLS